MRLYLALLPSNQDYNAVKNPATGGPTNELAQMAALTDAYVTELKTTFALYDISWKRFDGAPASRDSGHLTGLYAQQYNARNWLNSVDTKDSKSLALSIHSDAPGAGTAGVSHVGCRYDPIGSTSLALAHKVLPGIAKVFNTSRIMYLDGGGYVFSEVMESTPHIAIILEHGDHTVHADNVTLHTKPREIARASIQGIVDYWGMNPRVEPWLATSVCPDGTGPIGQTFANWLNAHPGIGPRLFDSFTGGQILYLANTDGFLIHRDWENRFYTIDV